MNIVLKKIIKGHVGPIYNACYDGTHFLYSTAADKYVTRWNIETGEQDGFSVKLTEASFNICLVQNNSKLLVGTNSGKVHIIDLETKLEIKCIELHKAAIFASIGMNTQSLLILGDADGNISIWNSNSFELLMTIPLNVGKIRCLTLSESESLLVVGSQDGRIRVFETIFFNELQNFEAHKNGVNTLIFSKLNKDVLFSAGKDGLMKLWDIKNNILLKTIPAHYETIYALCHLSELIVSGSRDKSIKIWNQNLAPLQKIDFKLKGHSRSVNGVGVIDGATFYSFSDDATLRIWSIENSLN
jgi:WD40 repeat protein